MRRLALLLALPLPACGDETVGTDSGAASTGADSTTTTTAPTTSSAASSDTGASTGSASESVSGTTTGSETTTGSTSSGTTQPVSGSTGDDTTGSSGSSGDDTTGSTSTTGGTTTSGGDTSSSDDTTGSEVVPPPVPDGTCNFGQGELTTFVEPMPQLEELHIVAMYQATANAATVTITRTGVPLTLFLSSYEPVAFTLDVAPGVLLEHVILNGYNMHTVQGEGAAMVTDLSGNFADPNWVACGYFWPMNDGGCDTPGNVAAAEALTGLNLTSFAGCYEGIAFSLE